MAMRLVFLDLYSFANSEICRETMSSLLYGKLSRTFILFVNASLQGDKSHSRLVNHATHERLDLTELILSLPFLLEYSFLKNREKVEICSTLIKKSKINIKKKILQSERSERHCSKLILFYFFFFLLEIRIKPLFFFPFF